MHRRHPRTFGIVTRRTAAGALVVAAAGCSEASVGGDAAAWTGRVDTLPSGTILIANPIEGRWTDREAWRLVEDLRIGAVEGDGPAMFGAIEDIGFGPRGEILVLDAQAQEVRVFDSRGDHLRTLGGEGGGPGELSGALGLSWVEGGNLWVTEVGNARYSVFDSSGTYLRSHRRPLPGMVYPWQGGFGPDGRLYDVLGRQAPDGNTHFVYYALNDSAAVVDSLPSLAYQPSATLQIPGSASLLGPRLTFRFDPEGRIWFGMTDEYRLYQRTLDGDTLRVVTRPVEGETVSEAEKDAMLEEAAQYSPAAFQRSQLPQAKPVFQRLLVDDASRLWVQRSDGGEQPGTVFDVIGEDGIFLGEVRSPARLEWMTPPEIQGDYVLGVTTDSLGVSYVVRLRIDR